MKLQELRKIVSIAIDDKLKVSSNYNEVDRIIEPFYLIKSSQHGDYYLIAFCHYRNEIRTFTLRKFNRLMLTQEEWNQKPLSIRQWYEKKKNETEFFKLDKIIVFNYPISQKKRLEKSKINLAENQKHMVSKERKTNPVKFPKKIKYSKMEREAMIRSPLEEIVFTQLNEDPTVLCIEIEPFKIPYIYNRVYHKYIPDALITYLDGHKELIEVKPSLDTQYKKNLAKFESAEVFANENNMFFKVIGVHGETNKGNYTDWSNVLQGQPEIDYIDWKSIGTKMNLLKDGSSNNSLLLSRSKVIKQVLNNSDKVEIGIIGKRRNKIYNKKRIRGLRKGYQNRCKRGKFFFRKQNRVSLMKQYRINRKRRFRKNPV